MKSSIYLDVIGKMAKVRVRGHFGKWDWEIWKFV
jgi:hypothetical protein